ncbi:MAG: hypothetical protein HYT79_10870 [Elusimicrobia bacterium]|nr:hypothetical protein [Elusimicrobiota bacterium]
MIRKRSAFAWMALLVLMLPISSWAQPRSKSKAKTLTAEDIDANIEAARRERGERKAQQADALFNCLVKKYWPDHEEHTQCGPCGDREGCSEVLGDEWYDDNNRIRDLLLDRDVSEHYVASAIHRYVHLASLGRYGATTFLRTVEDAARERHSAVIRRNAAAVMINYMKFVRPKKENSDDPDFWPAMTAVHAMHGLYDDNPNDGDLRDMIRTSIADRAANEEHSRLYQSCMSFLCSRFRSVVAIVNEERENKDLDVEPCR